MSSLDLTADFQAIKNTCKDLILSTAFLSDQQDHEAFANLFTEDAQLTRPGGTPLIGRAAILESYRSKPADRITRHLVTNTLVTDVTSNSAKAVSYVLLWSTSAAEPVEAFGRKANARQVLGQFTDQLVNTPDGWRIAQREASFQMYRD